MTFKPEVLELLPDNHKVYATAILDLASRLAPRKDVKMGVELNAENWPSPLYVHQRKISDYTEKFLEREMETKMQSAKEMNIASKNVCFFQDKKFFRWK